ncbi:MAG: DNA polymerase III subunit beta [Malacoplasma sp.]
MKIIIKKDILFNSLKLVTNLSSNNFSSPIIQGLFIDVNKERINLIHTNGMISINSKINNDNFLFVEEGTFLVNKKLFCNIIQKLNNEDIVIEKIDNSVLKIKTSNFDSNINILDYKEFPIISFEHKNWKEITLKANIFMDIKEKILQSVSQNKEKVSILNGICFNSDSNLLEIFSTDSFKLSYLKYKISSLPFKIVFDYSLILLIIDNLVNEKVIIYINGNNLIIKMNNILISSKVLEGNYPDVINIINSPKFNEISINKKNFINALERGIVLTMTEKRPICRLSLKNGESKIFFKSVELGNSEENIETLNFKGENIIISVNAHYLIALIKAFSSEKIFIGTSSETKPIVLWTEEEENFLQLVLPIRSY